MKIDLTRIPKQGLDIEEDYAPKILDLDTRDISYPAPIQVSLKVFKDGDSVHIALQMAGTMKFVCSRCLADFERPMVRNTKLDYEIKGETVLDISNDIRQEIILGYPLKPLCKENCKGLCPLCGQDLNKEECNCATTKKKTF